MTDSAFVRSKPSLRVVEQVADAEDVPPGSLEPPLNDAVDPTALDRLFEPTTAVGSTRRGRITFSYCGYDVTVASDGTVDVT
ncbi:HalOD1 output domain-containing protein [Natrialba sp. INN-245]|uniref:HalOD1 output domain-containing protein n=1 Tax=Natrialba sp. INN-245 TaxID=2690967 RepID=UPI00130FD1A3|nr:HalOD1 output domain-containing protein [Natrialba sp. INN-245]MWV39028.1 hypothetical protein [Natrialba sp. INN-245]